MLIRLAVCVCMISFIAGCFNGMRVSVAPPDCTTKEKDINCRTAPNEPNLMTEEQFFLNKSSALAEYWATSV